MAKALTPVALSKPMPIGQKLQIWAHETLEAIHKNFKTQGIFPEDEVYPGWFAKNAAIYGNSWQSTGAGFDSFHFHILHASQMLDVGVRDWAVEFMYNYYLNFVDMGVGKGRPISKVNRTLSADHDIRYMSSWNPKEGSTQRPAIAMEFRHQAERMRKYMANRYKYEAQVGIINLLDGLEVNIGQYHR
jgi:hypothetical protein